MKFTRRTAEYPRMDHKRNKDIMKKMNTEPFMNLIQTYRANWKRHVLSMPRSIIPFKCYVINQKEMIHRKTLQAVE
jgi:hypothetical protein